ncbi:hypothetical protein [Micromonospora sp. NPDC049645]|uniref:hypothetical protein n=1 Tax=Micromonospora sp. NPDC049645 TaxID=3155508 RepID=UPI00341D9CC4
MLFDTSTRPQWWRWLPASLLWAAVALVAVRVGQPAWWSSLTGADVPAAVVAATGAAAFLAKVLTPAVRRLWLGGLIPGPVAGWLLDQRRARWQAAGPQERVRIALAEPAQPTWIGDRWSGWVTRVRHEYGLDLPSVWPRLWLVLPETVRVELRRADEAFHGASRWGAWSLVFALTGLLWWPVIGLAVLILVRAVQSGRATAATVSDLGEAAVDLYALRVARQLGLAVSGPVLAPDVAAQVNARCRKGA